MCSNSLSTTHEGSSYRQIHLLNFLLFFDNRATLCLTSIELLDTGTKPRSFFHVMSINYIQSYQNLSINKNSIALERKLNVYFYFIL